MQTQVRLVAELLTEETKFSYLRPNEFRRGRKSWGNSECVLAVQKVIWGGKEKEAKEIKVLTRVSTKEDVS